MPLIDIAEFIDRRRVSSYQWSVIGIFLSIGLLDGLDIQAIGVAAPAISKDWGLRPKDLTLTFSAAPAGMIVGALALGALADRFGRKHLIVAATFLFGLLTLATAGVRTLAGGWMLSLGWPITVIFGSVAVPGLISAVGVWIVGRLPRDFS